MGAGCGCPALSKQPPPPPQGLEVRGSLSPGSVASSATSSRASAAFILKAQEPWGERKGWLPGHPRTPAQGGQAQVSSCASGHGPPSHARLLAGIARRVGCDVVGWGGVGVGSGLVGTQERSQNEGPGKIIMNQQGGLTSSGLSPVRASGSQIWGRRGLQAFYWEAQGLRADGHEFGSGARVQHGWSPGPGGALQPEFRFRQRPGRPGLGRASRGAERCSEKRLASLARVPASLAACLPACRPATGPGQL